MFFGRCVNRTLTFQMFPNIAGFLFLIFIFSNFLFFYLMFEKKSQIVDVKKISSAMTSYSEILERYFHRVDDEWRIKSLEKSDVDISKYDESKELNCSSLKKIEAMDFVATGWTKASYRIKLHDNYLALKTVNINGHDISKCLTHSSHSLEECYIRASIKVLNEILRMRDIAHENVIKILGYCVPNYPDVRDSEHSVSILTELGEPIDIIKLLQMSWEDRLKLSLGIAKLLHHLSTSTFGTISLNDFRRQQFVLVDGELKLTDIDDTGFEDPLCTTEPCCISSPKPKNDICVSCVLGRCSGFNEKSNILSAGRYFINYILPHGAPSSLSLLIDKIVTAFMEATWTTDQILSKTKDLVDTFITGKYRDTSLTSSLLGYKILNNSDLPAIYDYRCKLTVTGHGCVLSMFDAEEAALICNADPDCKAFVLTKVVTWTGRTIVHFKNGFQNYAQHNGTTLYIKAM